MRKGVKTIANDLQHHPGKRFAGTPPTFATLHILAILLCVGGPNAPCADGDASVTPPPDTIGRVGLAYGGRLPQFDLQIPDSRAEASGEEAAKKGLSWVRDLKANAVDNELDALWVYIRMGLSPVGLLAGSIYGGCVGESARKLDPAAVVLDQTIKELQVEQAVPRQVFQAVRQKSLRPLVLPTNSFPAESAFRVPTLMDLYAPLPLSFATSQPEKACGPSAFDGMDTLVLVRVVNHGLSGRDRHNPKLSLNLALRVTVIRAQDRTQLFAFYAQYESPARRFVDWAKDDATPFRVEFQRAVESLAEQIVAQSGLQVPAGPNPTGIVQAAPK
jgi:hypothetical protein